MTDETTNYPVPSESDFSMVPEKDNRLIETEPVQNDIESVQVQGKQISEGFLIAGGIIQSSKEIAIKTIDAVKDTTIVAIDRTAEVHKEKIRTKGNVDIENYRNRQLADVEKRKSDNETKINISGQNAQVAIVAINNDKVQNADDVVKIMNASQIAEHTEEKPKKKKGFIARLFGGDD